MSTFSKLRIKLFAREFFVYAFIGGFCTVTDLSIFFGLIESGLPVGYAAVISFSFASILNCLLCIKFLFNKINHRVYKELFLTFIVSAVGIRLSVGIIYGLIIFSPFIQWAPKLFPSPASCFGIFSPVSILSFYRAREKINLSTITT